MKTFWYPIAVLVGVLFVLAVVLLVRSLIKGRIVPSSPEEREEMAALAMTPLQRRASWALLIGLVAAAAAVVVVAREGPVAWFDDARGRLLFLAFVFVALGGHLAVLVPVGLAAKRGSGLDERDRRILARAPQMQVPAALIVLAAWGVALTETYRGAGIPTGFMYLVFWSVFVAQIVAHSGGILLGYWLARHHAEG